MGGIDRTPTISITLNGVSTTVPVTPEDVQDLLEELHEPACESATNTPTIDSAATAYRAQIAAEMMRLAQLANQLAPMPQAAPAGTDLPFVPYNPQSNGPTAAPPPFQVPHIPEDFTFDPQWLEDLGFPPASIPAPGAEGVDPSRVSRADVDEQLDALTLGLNAIQGDGENDLGGGGLNWGPFTNHKEKFDNLIADLRGNPTMANYQAVQSYLASGEVELSPDSQAVFDSLGETVAFLEAHRGVVVDEDIDASNGTSRLEHGLAQQEIREGISFLRDNDNHTLSDAGNWGPFTSDKESWDNHLKDMQNAIDDGDLGGAMEHYNWLRERAEGSDNIPRRTRDRIIAMEQYIPLAVEGPTE